MIEGLSRTLACFWPAREGVTDNIEVLQAQQSVASANESLISSLYSYNVSKIALGRAIGNAEAGVQEYLKGR